MAYYEGVTLKQRLEGGPLPVDEALDIATQIADGLARAHAQGVIHRDVKPGNIILAEDGVRILDFGLATFVDALQLTVAGSTLGTAPYMSPEQVKGETADASTDVWAAGVILYQMLTGHVPFRGSHHEAIAYAIRHETPASIRQERPDVGEEIEQLVFRALHKEKSIRYASGRELARALRQVRGQTMPLDLRTEPVQVPHSAREVPVRRRSRWRWAVAAAIVAVLGGAGWGLLPRERVPIVIIPVANQTGLPELDPYVPALTYAIIEQLSESAYVRPVPWTRMLETLRGFAAKKTVLSGNQVVAAFRTAAPGQRLIRPALIKNGERWHVQVEVLDGTRPTIQTTFETAGVPTSVLRAKLAHDLMRDTAAAIEQHFKPRWITRTSEAAVGPRLATLDAVRAMVEGIDAYEEQEYLSAWQAFTKATAEDPRSAIPQMWLARSAHAMRRDLEAREAARRAVMLLDAEAAPAERLLVEGIAAEITGERAVADARFQSLADAAGDDPRWSMERALFEVRRAQSKDAWNSAIRSFHDMLERDPTFIRPHVELCRAHNQIQDTQNAIAEAQRAVDAAQRAGWRGAEAQARLCLVEVLRQGEDTASKQAQEHAQLALRTLEELKFTYNIPRALFYLGLAAFERGLLQESIDYWTRAEKSIDAGGNEVLRPVVLSALAAPHDELGNAGLAFEYVSRSIARYADLGDERRAARQQKNLATMKVRYGENPEEGLREATAVLEVVHARGDVEFEIATLALIGDYHRNMARYAEAATHLHKALQLAQQQTLANRTAAANVAMARLEFDEGRYAAVAERLSPIVGGETPPPEAWIALGRAQVRLGDFAVARKTLGTAVEKLSGGSGRPLPPYLHLTLGELAFESGELKDARARFEAAADYWREPFNFEAAVEARAYLGLLEGIDGRAATGRAMVQSSLESARRMGRAALEMRCRMFLARLDLLQRRPDAALRTLEPLSREAIERAGLELRMQVLHWRGEALRALGRTDESEATEVRRLMHELKALVPAALQSGFSGRFGLRGIG
jgi:tetratricopeptide (TPR) repeat protein